MIVCGLKLTHDGAVSVVEDDKLLFCIEMEKIENNERYEMIVNTDYIENILLSKGMTSKDVDFFAIDGWGGYNSDQLAIQPRLEIGENSNLLAVKSSNENYSLHVSQYQERNSATNLLSALDFDGLHINGTAHSYSSYLHVTGHILSAYCTSNFAIKGENSFVLVWDGGMFPLLYHVEYTSTKITPCGPIFLLIGNIYSIFAQHYGPFKVTGCFAKDNLSVAGKVMAYIGNGQCRVELFDLFNEVLAKGFENIMGYANVFARDFAALLKKLDAKYTDEDILRSFHEFISNLLVEKLLKKIKRSSYQTQNLCIAGGCALNIKWNSSIRNSGIFRDVFVPPFPNDSGSAIGTALAKRINLSSKPGIDWNVYSGPAIIKNEPNDEWMQIDCSLKQLASLLFKSQEPVVFLNDKAEIGPRALGNRSILASPTSTGIKSFLNFIKNREDYRPISPICLEQSASEIFIPGHADPYMLFDHVVKHEWIERIPGVVHIDNTARLQTVNKLQNPIIYELLSEFFTLSSIPLLCNTSANYNGCGFFPDVRSATEWGKTKYVWCEYTLYVKKIVWHEMRYILETE